MTKKRARAIAELKSAWKESGKEFNNFIDSLEIGDIALIMKQADYSWRCRVELDNKFTEIVNDFVKLI